ncbi:hypothetical protein Sste5346_003566 [Sporothrix stenoceras]|uniref:Uncharacterized protein n=1 Tax=Sporothrix stenoceras TaxID=5173 RepID=A0ABR3ZBW1_9PEZI
MAPRNDDATAAQHGTPTRDKSSQSDRTGSKTDTPPQTPGSAYSNETNGMANRIGRFRHLLTIIIISRHHNA